MKNVEWLDHLNVTNEQFNNWTTLKPKDLCSSYWCLSKGYIDSAKYISWAKQFYKIPAMDHNYKNFPVDPSFFTQIQSVANWSQQLVPLYFYDNILFVLSTEPSELNWSFPVKYILATPEQLSYFWNQLNRKNIKPEHVNQQIAATEAATNIQSNNVEVKQTEPALDINTLQLNQTNKTEDLLSLQSESAPDFDLTSFDTLENQLHKNNENSKQGNDIEIDELEGLHDFNLNPKTSTEVSIEGLHESTNNNFVKHDDKPPEGLDFNSQPETEIENTVADMPPLSTTTKSLRLNKINKSDTKPNIQNTNIEPIINPVDQNISELKLINNEANNNELDTFIKINKYFDKSLIFELLEDKIKVTHQDGRWDLSNAKDIQLVETPNLFNFCLYSKLPFHGLVSDKDSLKQDLFKSLCLSNNDEFVTLMPIADKNYQINKFIFAIGTNRNYNQLMELEKTIPELQEKLSI